MMSQPVRRQKKPRRVEYSGGLRAGPKTRPSLRLANFLIAGGLSDAWKSFSTRVSDEGIASATYGRDRVRLSGNRTRKLLTAHARSKNRVKVR